MNLFTNGSMQCNEMGESFRPGKSGKLSLQEHLNSAETEQPQTQPNKDNNFLFPHNSENGEIIWTL